jgi:serine/threonine-protein kinase
MRALVPKNTVETVLRPGQVVGGQYRVDHLIGQGGMAAVWAGTNEHTGKRVALKVILLSLSTTREAQDLFHGEALAASRVNHPNVVTVFDVIGHEGMACIVMEMLDGETLAHYLAREGALSVDRATALLLPAMRGVAAANAQGVVHRDLKPQNIFICSEPDGRIVTTKVLDFGISVIVERGIDTSSAPKSALGTPGYMSPEHILGAANIDGRADVYGFGLLLYESLTGKMAFPGEPNTALFDRVLTKPALPVMVLRPDLPSGLVHRIVTSAIRT